MVEKKFIPLEPNEKIGLSGDIFISPQSNPVQDNEKELNRLGVRE
jgi:hypothetical protein